jgi:hypothetical protein
MKEKISYNPQLNVFQIPPVNVTDMKHELVLLSQKIVIYFPDSVKFKR